MPNKDPSIWDAIITIFREYGVVMGITFILSFLRVTRDNEEPKLIKRLLEAVIGSFIILIVGMTCKEFGMSLGWSYVASGFVGVFGVDQMRVYARRWAERRIDKE